jgi:1-aminocyclopropane-1-carboxylate deaminase
MTIQFISWPEIPDIAIQVFRLDKNHTVISGNKYYKLQPWLSRAKAENVALLSCGGAFSNHLHALAYAGKQAGIASYALVRALEADNLTCTMEDCKAMGMNLIPVSREVYGNRYSKDFASHYLELLDERALWVPEGGTDKLAVTSCESIGHELNHLCEVYRFNSVWLAVGSGGTLAGIARSLGSHIAIYAVPVMRNWHEVRQRIDGYFTAEQSQRIHWIDHASYGGFGRYNRESLAFHARLEAVSGIAFDPVYTAKVMRRMIELYMSEAVVEERPLMIHTGGLQGRRSIEGGLAKAVSP